MILSVLSGVVVFLAYFPYIKDIILKKTKPHAYSWLIWIITQCTAIAGMWFGGANWGLVSLVVGTVLVTVVFLLSLKFGTKNITKEDTIIFIAALCAILVWWQLDQPVLSIIMVTIIDVIGYLPTFRKSYHEPWSETLTTWFMFTVANILTLLSLSQYNLMTSTYTVFISIANLSFFIFCYVRRFYVLQPEKLN